MKVGPGTQVTIHYELFDGSGIQVESSEDEPVSYRHGLEEILPGLERGLEGAEVGAELKVELTAEDGYGIWQADGLFSVPRADFPADAELTVGDWIEMQIHAEDEGDEDGEVEARVVEVRDEEVVLDANHPLAGQALTFQVRVLDVQTAAD